MKLSIIIPVYNVGNILIKNFNKLKSIYQILKQNEFEIIYINDGSTDNSYEILEKIKQKKSNITVIHQENQGASGARNSGIEIARGKYIQFLDSDDYINWEKTIPLLYKSINKNIDALSYRICFVNENELPSGIMQKHPLPYQKLMSGKDALIKGFQASSICCWFFKTIFLKNNNLYIITNITHEDVEFTIRMLLSAKKVIFEDIIGYYYVNRAGSITKPQTQYKTEKYLYDEIIVAELIRNNITKETPPSLKIALEKNYNSVIWNLLWFFYCDRRISKDFKRKCIQDLKLKKLYPLKGKLKTTFQNFTKYIFNQPIMLNFIIKLN